MVHIPIPLAVRKSVTVCGFFILGRGMQTASRRSLKLYEEFRHWPDGFLITLTVAPDGPSIVFRKEANKLRFLGFRTLKSDVVVSLSTMHTAFQMMIAQLGVPQAYAEHRIAIAGNSTDAMRFTRCLNIVESLLFPGFLSKNILKRVPRLSVNDHLLRLRIYFIGIPFGL